MFKDKCGNKGHVNLRVTHRLLWRLYGYRAIVALISGVGILFAPDLFIGSSKYGVIGATLPFWLIGLLWILCAVMIMGALFRWSYRVARLGISISIVLYGLWGTGLLTQYIFNDGPTAALFAVLAYYSLALTSFLMLLEPPINPETAIENKQKEE